MYIVRVAYLSLSTHFIRGLELTIEVSCWTVEPDPASPDPLGSVR